MSTPHSLVPQPRALRITDGRFTAGPALRIFTPTDADTRREAARLAEFLRRATGWRVPVETLAETRDALHAAPASAVAAGTLDDGAPAIVLAVDPTAGGGAAEGYELRVTPARVLLTGVNAAGLFHATQTLRQLLPAAGETAGGLAAGFALRCLSIHDAPRFGWRGALLDSARGFHAVEDVLAFVDLLAFHKMNRLHWHLSDDQGWRVPIPGWPRLTEVGAWRVLPDGTRVGGFYTKEELRRVVAYAAERHIVVVPEFDLPGHTMAATVAYPELSCRGEARALPKPGGNFPHVLCAGRPRVYEFVADVLREAADIFPGPFLHIGGDECVKDHWRTCPHCQNTIRELGLAGEKGLERHFIGRVHAIIAGLGRRAIGWDETLELSADGIGHEVHVTYPATTAEDPLRPDALVQSWRDAAGVLAAARLGHDVIVSPNDRTYLNYSERRLTLENVHALEPLPDELTAEEARRVLGVETCLWEPSSEFTQRWRSLLPRLCAIAERAWSPREARDFEEFRRRLFGHRRRWLAWGVPSGALPALALTAGLPRLSPGDERTCLVCFHLRNRTDEPVLATASTGERVTLEPREARAVEIVVRAEQPWSPDWPAPVAVTWRSEAGTADDVPVVDEHRLLIAPDPLRVCPSADTGLPWKIAPDDDARFGVFHDDEGLHLTVDVPAATIASRPDRMPWQQDGLEIRVDARDDDARFACDGEVELVDFALVAVSPGDGVAPHGTLYRPDRLPAGTRILCAPRAGGYVARVLFPESWLRRWQESGGTRRFRLNLALNRALSDGRVAKRSWRPPWRSAENHPWSGTFEIAAPS